MVLNSIFFFHVDLFEVDPQEPGEMNRKHSSSDMCIRREFKDSQDENAVKWKENQRAEEHLKNDLRWGTNLRKICSRGTDQTSRRRSGVETAECDSQDHRGRCR